MPFKFLALFRNVPAVLCCGLDLELNQISTSSLILFCFARRILSIRLIGAVMTVPCQLRRKANSYQLVLGVLVMNFLQYNRGTHQVLICE
jgi:exosortase/archaeosortase